ncbi:hypothetical protein LNQ03_28470 [Klebsiella pneumoniae subsp. pneumoniae]|nr:hypothetical protein [Klebsiella pneumoniae subsp. pneumoniae]
MGSICCPTCARAHDTFLSTCQAIRAEGGPGIFSRLRRRKKRRLRPLFDRREDSTTPLLQDLQALRGRYPTTNWRLSSSNLRGIPA